MISPAESFFRLWLPINWHYLLIATCLLGTVVLVIMARNQRTQGKDPVNPNAYSSTSANLSATTDYEDDCCPLDDATEKLEVASSKSSEAVRDDPFTLYQTAKMELSALEEDDPLSSANNRR